MIREVLVTDLQKIVGKENVLTSPEALKVYSYDGTTNWQHEPEVVVFPTNAKEISEIMKLANAKRYLSPQGAAVPI